MDLPLPNKIPSLFPHPEAAFLELKRVASLLRAFNPSLPETLRFYEVKSDEESHSPVKLRLLFTNDVRPNLEGGIQDDFATDIQDALMQTLPSALAEGLWKRVMEAVNGDLSAIFDAAVANNSTSLIQKEVKGSHVISHYSSVITPFPLEFNEDAFLAQSAQVIYEQKKALERDFAPQTEDQALVFKQLGKIQRIHELLSQKDTGWRESQVILNHVNELQVKGEVSYESKTQQGWLSYAILAGGDALKPLLKMDNKNISVYTPYLDVTPVVAAVLRKNHFALNALLEAGVSPNVLVKPLPQTLVSKEMFELQEKLGDHAPLLVLAVAGSGSRENAQTVKSLLDAGALLSTPDAYGNTALHWAIKNENEDVFRMLINAGASKCLKLENDEGVTPEELLKNNPRLTAIYANTLNAKSEVSFKAPKP